ncbi:hypothetical protein MA16_Dca016072 [Dendrobium catenatum]|uniref:Uncharacterized protein n=1 Tax=Dendrobium catenatum TaxID=906689 RepID=A0A2I0VEM7_9ASPA|nr:hypothetical protein MA16_Dca016072 [Dendrobium catenatum]
MDFLKHSIPANPNNRPATPSENIHPPVAVAVAVAAVETLGPDRHRNATLFAAATTGSVGSIVGNAKGKCIRGIEGDDKEQDVSVRDGFPLNLARALLLVAPIQSQMLNLLLEKLPEHFKGDAASVGSPLNQLRSLDFPRGFQVFCRKAYGGSKILTLGKREKLRKNWIFKIIIKLIVSNL